VSYQPPILGNTPVFSDQVAFGIDPNTVYTAAQLLAAWVDVGWRVSAASATQGRQYELAQQQAGQGSWTMRNDDEALNPSNTSSPYWPNVVPYRPARTVAAWNTTALSTAGNILNDTNAAWPDANVSSEDASFEGGTVGHWAVTGTGTTPTLSNDTAHVKAGGKAMKVNFAATPGTLAGAKLVIPVIPGIPTFITAPVYLTANLTGATLRVNGTAYGTTSTLGSYQSLTAAFVPTTPVVTVSVTFTGTGAGAAWVDAVQPEFGTVGTAFTTTGPTFVTDWSGYIERWPQTWRLAGFVGQIQSPTVDAFALLPKVPLRDIMTEQVMSETPDAYYPCTNPAGVLQVSDATGRHGPGIIYAKVNQPVTGPNALCALGDTTPVVADALTSLKLGVTVGPLAPFLGFDPAAAVGSGPWTVLMCFQFPDTFGNLLQTTMFDQTIYVNDGVNNYQYGVQLFLSSNGSGQVLLGAVAGLIFELAGPPLPAATVQTPYGLAPNVPHCAMFTLNVDQVTVRLYLDGVSQGTAVGSSALPIPNVFPALGARQPGLNSSSPVNVGQVVIWQNRLVGATAAGKLGAAAATAFAGELSGTRYSRLLNYATVNLPNAIDAGMTAMGPASGLAGTGLLAALNDVVLAEGGNHNVRRDGTIVFSGRADRYTAHSAVWVFGENTAGGELPYEGDIAFDDDPTLVVNDVDVTRPGGVTQRASDATSMGRYFDAPLSLTPNLASDWEALDVATWTVQQYKDAHQRIQSLTFTPAANPALWACALNIQQGDRVTVKRRTSAGLTMSLDFYVEQIARPRVYGPGYQVTLLLSPVWQDQQSPPQPLNVWILGDATYGSLGTTTVLAR
jgi:hypothetical protein